MQPKQENGPIQSGDGRGHPNTGNASNPAPNDDSLNPSVGNQLLDEKAEKYLREVASIEDVPDAQDQQEMDETLQQTKNEE